MANKTYRVGRISACLAALIVSDASLRAEPNVETLASYPAPTFLENLDVAIDGAIYVTNYTGRGVERIRPGQKAERFADLDTHPVSILATPSGFLVAAHGKSFTNGPAFIGSGRLLTLDRTGKVIDDLPAPEAGMMNGMVRLPSGAVLIADSVKGQILHYDPAVRRIETWFSDPRLLPQTAPQFLPGANGLKLRDGALLVSSSAQRRIFKLTLTPDGAPEAFEPLLDLPGGADDFAVLPDGGLLVATHGETVLRVSKSGETSVLTKDRRVRGNTAVAVSGAGKDRRAIILGTGGFSEGGKDDAVVIAIPLTD
jgi:hypothetical protein